MLETVTKIHLSIKTIIIFLQKKEMMHLTSPLFSYADGVAGFVVGFVEFVEFVEFVFTLSS